MKFTITKKIGFGFTLLIICIIILSVLSSSQIARVDRNYSHTMEAQNNKVFILKNMKIDMLLQSDGINGYLLTGETSYLTDYDSSSKRLLNDFEQFAALSNDEESAKLLESIKKLQAEFIVSGDRAVQEKILENEEQYLILINSANDIRSEFNEQTDQLIKKEELEIKDIKVSISKETKEYIYFVIGISIFAIISAILLALWIGRTMASGMKQSSAIIKKVSNGNLSEQIASKRRKDEFGEMITSLNKMNDELRVIVEDVRLTANTVASSSEEMKQNANESSIIAEQVSLISEKTAKQVESQILQFEVAFDNYDVMTSSMEEITDKSIEMKSRMNEVTNKADFGSETLQDVVNKMKQINLSVEDTSKIIRLLDEKSKEIKEIASLITRVSEQTNLLALNAAIEAARAGEHGKGFSVVAEEVRNLAEESKNSADLIQTVTETIQKEITKAVEGMDSTNIIVHQGLSGTEKTSAAFLDILQSIGQMSENVEDVTKEMEGLSISSKEIKRIMESVNTISANSISFTQEASAQTEEQLASMQELSLSTQKLSNLANRLQKSVSHFEL